MRRIVAAGATDVGQVRSSNEDAYLLGDSVFAVADGMGGHVAGEVASAAALEPIQDLDGRVFSDAAEAVAALRDAVTAANTRVTELAETEPSYRGMGTTLTAALVEGRRLHVAHVGDSRAYLLRDGHFSQLTDDHTLVQHLVDEGQITREEAEQHPQRSIVTRAIGVSEDIEVDSMSLDLQPADQLLLCSDGLTGVLPDDAIAEEMLNGSNESAVVDRLIDRANEAGGPDNITVLLLHYDTDEANDQGRAEEAPAGPATVSIRSRQDRDPGDWAGSLGAYGELRKDTGPPRTEVEEERRIGRVLTRTIAGLFGLAVLVGLLVVGGRFVLSQQYFVGLEDDEVVIYQGIDASIGPFELATVVERTRVYVDDVQPYYRPRLEEGIQAADLNDARRIVAGAPRTDELEGPDTGDPADDPEPDGGTSP